MTPTEQEIKEGKMSEHQDRAIHALDSAIRALRQAAALANLGDQAMKIQGTLIRRHIQDLDGVRGAMLQNRRAKQ